MRRETAARKTMDEEERYAPPLQLVQNKDRPPGLAVPVKHSKYRKGWNVSECIKLERDFRNWGIRLSFDSNMKAIQIGPYVLNFFKR